MAVLHPSRLLTWFLLSSTTLLSIAPFTAFAQQPISYNYGLDTEKRMVKRQSQVPFIVSGPDNRGIVIPRKEVRDLEQDKDLWALYMLGLDYLQKSVDQDDPLSWYGLTGIHGVPYKTWAGVGPTPGNEQAGYCTHSSILFPTWHRPYLALYEQVLFSVIAEIASWWPEGSLRQRYQTAAERFRIPFWDWAAKPPSGQSVLPLSVGVSAYIKVDGPYGPQVISNPLFTYSFNPFNKTAMAFHPWNIWNHTLRSPNTNDTSAVSNNQQVALNFDFNSDSLRQRILVLFRYSNYTAFSNNAWVPAQSSGYYDSLESLHDTVHTLAGGGGSGQPNLQGGHMAFIPYSAFDPLFFLHHCNVDRLFALWQAVNTDTWVTPQPATVNSYTTSKGQIQDEDTALTPFFARLDGTFWTSDTVRDHERFGYTYPEFVGGSPGTSGVNASSLRARRARSSATRVKQSINRLYGHSSASGLFLQEMEARRKHPGDQTGRVGDEATPSIFAERGAVPRKGVVFIGNRYREWIANIYVGQQALNGPFSIHFFLGSDKSISPDPRNWPFATNHVGTMGVFAAPPMGAGHSSHHDVDISGTVPLTSKLLEKVKLGELDSLQPGDVKRYLAGNLRKRVVTADGRVVDCEKMRRLRTFGVRVVSAEVQAPYADDELPVWGEVDVEFDMS